MTLLHTKFEVIHYAKSEVIHGDGLSGQTDRLAARQSFYRHRLKPT